MISFIWVEGFDLIHCMLKSCLTCNCLWVHFLGGRKDEDRIVLKRCKKIVKWRNIQHLSQHYRTDKYSGSVSSWDIKKRMLHYHRVDICKSLNTGCLFQLDEDTNCTVIPFWFLFLQNMKTKR